MAIIIIIPAIVCLFALFRDSVQKTFLSVVLPFICCCRCTTTGR